MSIERMEHVAVLVPAAEKNEAIEWLYKRREMQVMPFRETGEEWEGRFKTLRRDATRAETEAGRLQFVTSFLREHAGGKRDFLSGLFPVKILATGDELSRAAKSVDVEAVHAACQKLSGEMDAAEGEERRLGAERERLRELGFISAEMGRLRALVHVSFRIVQAGEAARAFVNDERMRERAVAEAAATSKTPAIYVVAAAAADAGLLREVIDDYGLRELSLPEKEGTVKQELARVEEAMAAASRRQAELRRRAAETAGDLKAYELALAWWESERSRATEQQMMVSSGNVFAARGYAKAEGLERLRSDLEEAFPGAALVKAEAPAGEEPPVSLKWNHFVRPAALLVRMFGLPRYHSFDPTPYLMLMFFMFFGMCFGDLVYGIALIGVAALLKRRFAGQRNLVEFFRLFTYAGVTTMIFGVLTGSWASDLTSYFGQGNALDRLRVRLTLLDPMQKPMLALGISIGIGIVNQFYGIVLKFLSNVWRGDVKSALYDGGLWFVYLSSLLAAGLSAAGALPGGIAKPALAVVIVTAVGLVLTQGRDQKTWGLRIATGVVSLYGILGGYGTTSFIGDVLSYSRLLALGMTTTVIGMAFNIVAGFVRIVPVAGWALFVLVCLFGHSFNFVMSILGSFVHPARLMFLEFFGRFYESGGTPFRPFGFRSSAVELVEGH